MLVDHDTGRTYTATGPRVRVGRERANSDIIISDPNVSRSHCLLTWDGGVWHIEDLQSTNGTIVNNVDVRECTLRDGDLIILGLVNLEFREVM
jgi:pSer/pThr/pTyr-binding forkhead associated (FHA) protein